jgi:hypothetical protein
VVFQPPEQVLRCCLSRGLFDPPFLTTFSPPSCCACSQSARLGMPFTRKSHGLLLQFQLPASSVNTRLLAGLSRQERAREFPSSRDGSRSGAPAQLLSEAKSSDQRCSWQCLSSSPTWFSKGTHVGRGVDVTWPVQLAVIDLGPSVTFDARR